MTERYTVSWGQDAMNQRCFRFVGDNEASFLTPFVREAVNAELSDLYNKIAWLVRAAAHGERRGGVDVEQNGIRLRRHAFGDDSLSVRSPFKPSLLLDLDEYCATIPWELVRDGYGACSDPDHRWTESLGEHAEGRDVCPQGHPMTVFQGPLALIKHLGVRGMQRGLHRPVQRLFGHVPKALMFGDPQEDLGGAQDLDILYQTLSVGYDVQARLGSFATRVSLLEALEDPTYAVIYVFTHGERAQGHLPPRLCLRDAEFLCARDLPARLPGQPFIFLNCCWSGQAEWSEIAGATQSLASALLQRGASAVVGPLCEITPKHAGRDAGEFFSEALCASTLGHALARVRAYSYEQYCQGEADLSWFAYRLYGDPERCLATSIWNDDGTLRKDAFTIDPLRLERHMEALRKRHGASEFSRAMMAEALASIESAGAAAFPLPMLSRLTLPWLPRAWAVLCQRLGLRQARLVHEPETAHEGFVQRSDVELRHAFGNLLPKYHERLRKVAGWHLAQAFPLGPSDLLDACGLPGLQSSGGFQDVSAEQQALEKVREILGALLVLPDRLTPGAAFVMQQIWLNVLLWGRDVHPKHVTLAAFLYHPLIGSPWVLYKQTDHIEHIRDRLVLLRNNPPAHDLDLFVHELLERARSIAGREDWVDEYTLFCALCELTGWRVGVNSYPPPRQVSP